MTADSIVYLEDVTVDYDGFKALDRLSFYMDRQELRIVIGPNGAGKTTLLDVISGRVRPESGRVIFGHLTDLTTLRENEIAALGIVKTIAHPTSGPLRVVGAPFHLSADDTEPCRPPPRLGEHTGEVLKQVLAVSDADLQALQNAGAFGKEKA